MVNEHLFQYKNRCSDQAVGRAAVHRNGVPYNDPVSSGDDALRPAIELAFLVAALGSRQRPSQPSPVSLRPFLRFQKLPTDAVDLFRAAVEDDEAFRQRVAAVADEAAVGEAGLLWLQRPDGWESELAEWVGAKPSATLALSAGDKVLLKTQQRLRQATAALAVAQAEAAGQARIASELEAMIAKGKRTRRGMEQEMIGLRHKLERSEAALEHLKVQASPAPTKVATDRDERPAPAPVPTVDLVALGQSLQAAESARDALSAALAAARECATSEPTVPVRSKGAHRARRRRLRLPGGVIGDTVEAASFFLTRADVVVVVDGYNVAKTAFPMATLVNQREQLLALLDEVHARFGTAFRVVFDGADVGRTRAARHPYPVEFSPAGTTADDVIVSWVTAAPLEEAIVVVTSDNAVRVASDMFGAHVVHAPAFLAAAGRR